MDKIYKIEQIEGKNLGCVALKDIKKGTLILQEKPQVIINGNAGLSLIHLLNSYNKINLVPFGEFLPLEIVLKNIGLKSLANNYQSYSKGDKRKIIEINKNNFSFNFLPLICYEIIYSGRIFSNPDFSFIINISEDGWFGQSIGPKQHFIHSIYRAIESGKYVFNSGHKYFFPLSHLLHHRHLLHWLRSNVAQ